MNALLQWDGFDVWQLAGWTMLHFLWLGALVAMAAMFCRWLLRRRSPELRYTVAIGCLVLLAAMPAAIAVWQFRFSVPSQGGAVGEFPIAQQTVRSNILELAKPTTQPSALGSAGSSLASITPINEAGATDSASAPTESPNSFTNWNTQRQLAASTINVIAGHLPWLWLIGTPLTFLLTASGVIGAERLRRSSRLIESGPIAETCARLARTLRIGRRVTVAVCERIAAPVLVGIVRPIILLPPAALTGWSPDEIEMVLLHELAHVRRWDNLVNLAQRLIEALLFFHPAVWLVSNWVRREREACCDAVVVVRTNRPHAYAELLVALAAQLSEPGRPCPRPFQVGGRGRPGSLASSAMAAGPLRSRIRRILQLEEDPMLISSKSLGVVMSSLLLAATLVVLNLPTRSQAEESTSEKKELSAKGTDATENGIEPNGDANELHALQKAATQNNLKSLAIALLNYQAAKKRFPPSAKFDASGKPLLSWRVLVLPYLDSSEAKLYDEFHLDEPWDSGHNLKLLARMPKVFQNPRIHRSGMTNYLAVVGKDCLFDGTPKGIRFAQIRDGAAHTIALVEADADRAVEWTRPEDWNFDSNAPTAGLGSFWPRHWFAARADGSVNSVDNSEPAEKVRELFTCRRERPTNLQVYDDFEGSAVDGQMEMVGGGMESVSTDDDTATTFGMEDQRLIRVPFVVGATRFADGDRITVNEVRGTAATFEPGNVYWIKGTFTLESRDRAALSAFTTSRYSANAMGSIRKNQTTIIKRGSGTFTLCLPMSSRGWPHVSFYPADGGQSFGGEYFGTGDSVLKEWWGTNRKFPSLEDQKLADMAWKSLHLELEPIDPSDRERVRALGYEGGLKIVGGQAVNDGKFWQIDILVGLHVWPITSLNDVANVLNRDDLAELTPLKFYVVRRDGDAGSFAAASQTGKDIVVTGRIDVDRPPNRTPDSIGGAPAPDRASQQDNPNRQRPERDLKSESQRAAETNTFAEGQEDLFGKIVDDPFGDGEDDLFGPPERHPTGTVQLRYDGKSFQQWRNMLQAASEGSSDQINSLQAVGAFAAAGFGPQAADALLAASYTEFEGAAQVARGYLKRISPEDSRPLTTALTQDLEADLSPKRRISAIRALAAIGRNAKPAIPILQKRLTSDDPGESVAAAAAIKMIVGKDQFYRPIAEMLGEQLGIKAVETDSGAWAILPRDDAADDGAALNDFNNALDAELQKLTPPSGQEVPDGTGGGFF